MVFVPSLPHPLLSTVYQCDGCPSSRGREGLHWLGCQVLPAISSVSIYSWSWQPIAEAPGCLAHPTYTERWSCLYSFFTKFILLNWFWDQFCSLSRCLKMSRFPKSSFNRRRVVSVGNSVLILEGIDLNKDFELPVTSYQLPAASYQHFSSAAWTSIVCEIDGFRTFLGLRADDEVFQIRHLFMVYYLRIVLFFMNSEIFYELCDPMRFEVNCAKSHHRIINNYSSSPNGLWVNSPRGRRPSGLLTQRPWGREE